MTRPVVTTPEAESDPLTLYDHIEERGGPARAPAYVERIRPHCEGFGRFPDRGARRDDVWHGLRTVGFERRVTVAFIVTPDPVRTLRVLYCGNDPEAAFGDE